MKEIAHTYPVNDLKPHNTGNSVYCPCKPVVEKDGNSIWVIHNSYDGREFFEVAIPKEKNH